VCVCVCVCVCVASHLSHEVTCWMTALCPCHSAIRGKWHHLSSPLLSFLLSPHPSPSLSLSLSLSPTLSLAYSLSLTHTRTQRERERERLLAFPCCCPYTFCRVQIWRW